MKLYIAGPRSGGEGVYYLITERGEVLASHICSHSGYARGDLESGRPERQKKWKKRFGDYEVLTLGEDDMTPKKLQELNENYKPSKKDAKENADNQYVAEVEYSE